MHTIPESTFMTDPIYLTQPQNKLVVGKNSEVCVIEIIRPLENTNTTNHRQTEIILEKGAKIKHYLIQHTLGNHLQMADIQISQLASSQYKLVTLIGGGLNHQINVQINLNEPNANAELMALTLAHQHYQTDLHFHILHHAPACKSTTYARAIAKDTAKSAFTGKIYVAKNAALTEAALQSKNLLLDSKAEIKTLPQLEIYHDNIQCKHGATVGSLDEDALFYLRSRGLEDKEARRLMIAGFLNPIVTEVPPVLQTYITDMIDAF